MARLFLSVVRVEGMSMNQKYLVVGALVLIIGVFYAMAQSNKKDEERLKQAEIAHIQKLEQEKADALNHQYGGSPIKAETIDKVVTAKMDAKPETNPQQAEELNKIILEWADAATVAGATSRIALSQPVAKMQEIKRAIGAKQYQGCLESTRLLYNDAMNTNIDAYLEFMKGKEYELSSMSLMVDYNKQLELAEREKASCSMLTV